MYIRIIYCCGVSTCGLHFACVLFFVLYVVCSCCSVCCLLLSVSGVRVCIVSYFVYVCTLYFSGKEERPWLIARV